MDERHANDMQLMQRYLQGKLSDEEVADFEERLLSSADLLDELESSEQLQQGLQDVATLQKANASAEPTLTERLASNVASLFSSPRYAMAASFLLLVSLGFSSVLFQQNVRLNELVPGAAVSTEIVPMVSVRSVPGGGPVNILGLGQGDRHFVLMLDPGFKSYNHYRATVFQLDSDHGPVDIWRVDDLLPAFEDMLALGLPGSILSPGDYEIRLEGWQDEWPADHGFDRINTINFTCITR